MHTPILSVKNIKFSYNNDDYVLDDVSFDINAGEYICVIGHNGSGKSTISKMLSGLIKPLEGQLFLQGTEINSSNVQELRKKVGIIFQNPDNQFIGITTEDDIAFGLENYKIDPSKMKMLIDNTASIINIENLLTKEAFNLSGGQKQKVAITSVLTLVPQIIIFDESTSMLDPKAKLQIKELMKWLQINYKRTIISITHDMEELINADKLLCMNSGKVARYDNLNFFINDYNFLIENSLDLPNNLKLSKYLSERGLVIKPSLNKNELIEELCK